MLTFLWVFDWGKLSDFVFIKGVIQGKEPIY